MRKATVLALLLAGGFAVTGPAAVAQSLATGPIMLTDHSMSSHGLIGATVTDGHGHKLGTIADVLVKGSAEEPTVVLKTATKMVVAPISHFTVAGSKVEMPGMTPAMVAQMPGWTYNWMAGG